MTQNANLPHFLRFARAIALVSGCAVPVLSGCSSDSSSSAEDAGYDGSVMGKVAYDGGSTGTLPCDGCGGGVMAYEGGTTGVQPAEDAGTDANDASAINDGGDGGGPNAPPDFPEPEFRA